MSLYKQIFIFIITCTQKYILGIEVARTNKYFQLCQRNALDLVDGGGNFGSKLCLPPMDSKQTFTKNETSLLTNSP